MARKQKPVSVQPQRPSITFKPKHPQQLEALETLHENEITFLLGPAGTAKTFLATVYSINEALAGEFDKIFVTRPAVTSGAEIGFLPGSAEDKMKHFLQPIYDARDKAGTQGLVQIKSYFEVLPLCYMRGRTIENAILIVDEAQNLTPSDILTIVTRIGERGKIIFCGDSMQNDLREAVLDQAAATYDGARVGGYSVGAYIFTEAAIVRHPLTTELIKRTMNAEWYRK